MYLDHQVRTCTSAFSLFVKNLLDIKASELTYIKRIGGGCFGSVYEGECRGMPVAIKKLFKQDLSSKALTEFKQEVEVCRFVLLLSPSSEK